MYLARKISLFCIFMIISALLYGCATLADARMAKGSGSSKIYNVLIDRIWNAMPEIIKSVGLEYAGDNRQEGYILAQRGITAFSYGEEVAIFMTPVDKNKTRVEIVSKRALATNIFAPDWSSRLFEILDAHYTDSNKAL